MAYAFEAFQFPLFNYSFRMLIREAFKHIIRFVSCHLSFSLTFYYQTNSTKKSPAWEAHSCSIIQQIRTIIWNSETSLVSSHQPAIGPYHEPDQSSPHLFNFFIFCLSDILLRHHLNKGFQKLRNIPIRWHVNDDVLGKTTGKRQRGRNVRGNVAWPT
jgi:hypothetical protein